jgi:hypothetical protein
MHSTVLAVQKEEEEKCCRHLSCYVDVDGSISHGLASYRLAVVFSFFFLKKKAPGRSYYCSLGNTVGPVLAVFASQERRLDVVFIVARFLVRFLLNG